MLVSRLAVAGLLALSFAAVAAPTASAWCYVNLGPDDGFVCQGGPQSPQGQDSVCAFHAYGSINPGGDYGCVAVGEVGTNLVCVKPHPLTEWFCA